MKIFKKTVALFLALTMICSLSIFASAATVYPDESAITHKEAVAVLTELEVLQGDSYGFRPSDGLTRAEQIDETMCELVYHGRRVSEAR